MKSATNKPTHVSPGNVLDDLGFSPEQAMALKFKAELYQAILKVAKNYTQKELQRILREPQPRVSELLNGKIANKSVDKLLYYAGRLGIEAKARFVQTQTSIRPARALENPFVKYVAALPVFSGLHDVNAWVRTLRGGDANFRRHLSTTTSRRSRRS